MAIEHIEHILNFSLDTRRHIYINNYIYPNIIFKCAKGLKETISHINI